MHEGMNILLRLLSPIAPHIAQTLWREFGFGSDVLEAAWPAVDDAALMQDEIELVLQVNGKHRGSIRVPSDASRETMERLALENPNARKHIAGQTAKKVIVVPGRLVNIVV
jgi:leucyl-tRNA synthetase